MAQVVDFMRLLPGYSSELREDIGRIFIRTHLNTLLAPSLLAIMNKLTYSYLKEYHQPEAIYIIQYLESFTAKYRVKNHSIHGG